MSFELYTLGAEFFASRPEYISKIDQQIQEYLKKEIVSYDIKDLMKTLINYSDQEKKLIFEDLKTLAKEILPNYATGQKEYLFTGGPPASGKSVLLKNLLDSGTKKYAHIDPHTKIYSQMSAPKSDKKSIKDKYPYWKNAVYFISSALLGMALNKGYLIAHKTSSISSFIATQLMSIKNQGYKIRMAHLSTSLEICQIGENKREMYDYPHWDGQNIHQLYTSFYFLFPEYLKKCDEITLYFRETETVVVKAATIYPGNKLEVHDSNAYLAIIALHDKVCIDGSWARHLTKEGGLKIQST